MRTAEKNQGNIKHSQLQRPKTFYHKILKHSSPHVRHRKNEVSKNTIEADVYISIIQFRKGRQNLIDQCISFKSILRPVLVP